MVNPETELSAIGFGELIGGLLNAVITAQSMAAKYQKKFTEVLIRSP